jgi:hypothetical protein
MMDRETIEDVLRRPAPDQPAALAPLGLDGSDVRRVRGAIQGGPQGRRVHLGSVLVVLAVALALAVTWQLAGIGSTVPTPAPSSTASRTAGPTPAPSVRAGGPTATFTGGGITFTYPSTWRLHRTNDVSTMGSTIAIVGTADLSGCGGDIVGINCAYAANLEPGQVLVFVGTGASPGGSVQEPPGGFVDFVDGMPAVVTTLGPIPQNHQDEGRAWQIGMPRVVDNWYVVDGSYRGPGIDALRDEVDALTRSIRFDVPAPSLPTDAASIDALVAIALDALDRGARESNYSTYYACFPRQVGSSEPTVIEDGPGGPLVGPIRVTCAVSMKAEAVGLFAMTLAASWEAGPGYAAGTYREIVHVAADGELGSMQSFNDTFFPPTTPEVTPAPATTPIALAPGSLVEVLFPGVMFYAEPNHNDSLSDLPHGERLWIVAGPTRAGGESWYRVQWQPTPTYDGIPGWMPDTLDGHPVVEPVAPRCPSSIRDVVDLVDLVAAERLACFGDRPITLGPVTLRGGVDKTSPATGSPAWLADSATIAMFGSAGPQGVEGPLLVRAGPDLAALPLETWLEITGHFDDPAAAGCQRSWTGDAGSTPSAETTAEQVFSCREQFVITAVRTVAAPQAAVSFPGG